MVTFQIATESRINVKNNEAWEEQAYGMIEKDMVSYLNDNLRMMPRPTAEDTKQWLMTCMLSDCQEMLARDMKEECRQLINRVKYLSHTALKEC